LNGRHHVQLLLIVLFLELHQNTIDALLDIRLFCLDDHSQTVWVLRLDEEYLVFMQKYPVESSGECRQELLLPEIHWEEDLDEQVVVELGFTEVVRVMVHLELCLIDPALTDWSVAMDIVYLSYIDLKIILTNSRTHLPVLPKQSL
jgi:hypothetical protein